MNHCTVLTFSRMPFSDTMNMSGPSYGGPVSAPEVHTARSKLDGVLQTLMDKKEDRCACSPLSWLVNRMCHHTVF